MDAVNLQIEYESDSTAVKSLPHITTKYGGGDVEERRFKNPSMFNASMFIDAITGENEYEYYLAYLKVNGLTEAEYPFIHDEDDYVSEEDIEKGENATTSAPQKSPVEVTSMNSFSTLKSDSSTTSGKSDEQPQSRNKKSKNGKNSKKGRFFATLKKSFTKFVRGEAAASSDSESDISIASEIIEGGTRKYAGGGENIAAAIGCERSLETNSSMLNAMADGESTETVYDFYQAYLKANDLSEVEYPFIPNENDASHISKEDIVKWIEDGKKSAWEVTSMNSFSTLKSDSSTTSEKSNDASHISKEDIVKWIEDCKKSAWKVTSMNSFSTLKSDSSKTSEKSNYGIREIADEHVDNNDDDTLEDVISLASTNESNDNDFPETPIIRHQN
uniref:Uncharacterized protein n=1 Tax=Panagrolaimus sp. PS1159 TaxID=55785 RepID=A0AC35GD13_9BILA